MKRVQKEVRSILKNLFHHVRLAKQNQLVTKERLNLLIKKINKVGLKSEWKVAFGEERFSIVNGDGSGWSGEGNEVVVVVERDLGTEPCMTDMKRVAHNRSTCKAPATN